tara:strand:+ start:206 stop:361 length:156 start_codon:yes stop_codon:yes gene_type:complete
MSNFGELNDNRYFKGTWGVPCNQISLLLYGFSEYSRAWKELGEPLKPRFIA